MDKKLFKKLIKNSCKKGDSGRELYNTLKKKKDGETSVIVFPHHDEELNRAGLTYLATYLKRCGMKKAIIVTCDDFVANNASSYSSRLSEVLVSDEESVISMIHVFVLDDSMKNFVVISNTLPEGRKSHLLIESGLFTKELVVAVAIYYIIPFEKIEDPLTYLSGGKL